MVRVCVTVAKEVWTSSDREKGLKMHGKSSGKEFSGLKLSSTGKDLRKDVRRWTV